MTPTTIEPKLRPIYVDAPTRPVEVTASLIQRGWTCLISIYPKALEHSLMHNGITRYSIPAAPRGSYSRLKVYDTQAWINRPSEADGKMHLEARPIPSYIVADNLQTVWGRHLLHAKSGFYPGVGIIQGEEPTEAEFNTLRDSQNNLFDWLIKDAHGKHVKGETTEITDIHRLAAWEMLDRGAETFPWYPKIRFESLKDCLACGAQIPWKSKVCSKCSTNLVDWYLKYGLDPAQDPAIADFLSQMDAVPSAKKGKNA